MSWIGLLRGDPEGAAALGLVDVTARGPLWDDRVKWWTPKRGPGRARYFAREIGFRRAIDVTARFLSLSSACRRQERPSPVALAVAAWQARGINTALARILVREALRQRFHEDKAK